MEEKTIQVFLNDPQLAKLRKGVSFQLSHPQLEGGHRGGLHHVGIVMHKHHHSKLMKNLQLKKGFRFSPDVVVGHGLWDSVKSAASNVGSFVKNYVPKSVVKAGLSSAAIAASTAVGNPELGVMATPFINKAVDAGYAYRPSHKISTAEMARHVRSQGEQYAKKYHPDAYAQAEDYGERAHKYKRQAEDYGEQAHNYRRQAKQQYDDYADEAEDYGNRARNQYQQARQSYASPPGESAYGGYRGSGLKKGSPEMREKMARLRSMRKSKGGDLVSDAQNVYNGARTYLGVGVKGRRGGDLVSDVQGAYNGARTYLGVGVKGRRGGDLVSDVQGAYNGARTYLGVGVKGGRRKVTGGNAADDWFRGVGETIDNGWHEVIQNPIEQKIIDPAKKGWDEKVAPFLAGQSDVVKEFFQDPENQKAAAALGRQLAGILIHQGIPMVAATLASSLADALAVGTLQPELIPVASFIAGQCGKQAGTVLAGYIGEQTGLGFRRRGHIHTQYGQFTKGIPQPIMSRSTSARIQTEGLRKTRGGSFLPLG